MNEMSCSGVDELLAGYAANALNDDEGCEVAAHLAECRNHDVGLAVIGADFERLALIVEPVEPPTPLRSSLLDAFDREVAGGVARAAAPTLLGQRRSQDAAARVARSRWFAGAGFGYALAAAMLVVAIGLGVWGLSRDGGGNDIVTATTGKTGNRLEVTYLQDRQVAILAVDLSAPPEGRTYQAWQIVNGQPVSLGVLTTHSGYVAFPTGLAPATAVALTLEPVGGSVQPTSEPILMTELRKS